MIYTLFNADETYPPDSICCISEDKADLAEYMYNLGLPDEKVEDIIENNEDDTFYWVVYNV